MGPVTWVFFRNRNEVKELKKQQKNLVELLNRQMLGERTKRRKATRNLTNHVYGKK